jgi:hypothetical protein
MNIALEFADKGNLSRALSFVNSIPEDIIGHIAF